MTVRIRLFSTKNAPMVKLVDTTDLSSVGQRCPCRFKSYWEYLMASMVTTLSVKNPTYFGRGSMPKTIKIGSRTAELTLVDYPTMDDPIRNDLLKSSGRAKQEIKTK